MSHGNTRPLPADFVQWAAVETNAQLRARYGMGDGTVSRFRRETGISGPGRTYASVAAPSGFAAVAPTMSMRALAERYGCHRDMAARWCRDLGVAPLAAKPGRRSGSAEATVPKVRRSSAVAAPFRSGMHAPAAVTRHERDMSSAGQAADYLRQFGAVWRCNDVGAPSIGGKFWRRGNAVLTDAEIVARADYLRRKRNAPTGPAYSLVGNATALCG